MARRPSRTFLTSKDLVAAARSCLPQCQERAELCYIWKAASSTNCTDMKTTVDEDLPMCLSDLTSHEANRTLEPFGPLLPASPTVLSVLLAGLSGHIWQHVTAAVLLLLEWPGQLQPLSANATCRLRTCWVPPQRKKWWGSRSSRGECMWNLIR